MGSVGEGERVIRNGLTPFRYDDTNIIAQGRTISYPLFYRSTDPVPLHTPILPDGDCRNGGNANCKQVSFFITNRSTYAQYAYTPFVETHFNGGVGTGGVFLFMSIWNTYFP